MDKPDRHGWLPIESAPKTSEAILVWVPRNKCHFEVYWEDNAEPPDWYIFGANWKPLVDGEPTHWQPLPPPPEDT